MGLTVYWAGQFILDIVLDGKRTVRKYTFGLHLGLGGVYKCVGFNTFTTGNQCRGE